MASDQDELAAKTKSRRSRTGSAAGLWPELLGRFNQIIDDLDVAAAAANVRALQEAHPDEAADELVERLIREKCIKTGTIGAVTSGAAIIPGVGTAAALTLGVAADIGATFKLQAELVLEIAAARGRSLSESEKRAAVLLVTGMSAGANQALTQAGKRASLKLMERYAQKWVAHALPFVGVAASAATNVLATYLVGKRADAYFQLGPEAVGDWTAIWRAISGVDERALAGWLAEGASSSWSALRSGASGAAAAITSAGQATGSLIAKGATSVAEYATAGAGAVANAGKIAGASIADASSAAVDTAGAAAGAVGDGVSGVANKVGGLFIRRRKAQPQDEPSLSPPPADSETPS